MLLKLNFSSPVAVERGKLLYKLRKIVQENQSVFLEFLNLTRKFFNGLKSFFIDIKKKQYHHFTEIKIDLKKFLRMATFTYSRAADFSFEGRISFKIKTC